MSVEVLRPGPENGRCMFVRLKYGQKIRMNGQRKRDGQRERDRQTDARRQTKRRKEGGKRGMEG